MISTHGRHNIVNEHLNGQTGLKKATGLFKKGDITASEFYESHLRTTYGDQLPKMLPKIIRALPPNRAAALKVFTQVRQLYIAYNTVGACVDRPMAIASMSTPSLVVLLNPSRDRRIRPCVWFFRSRWFRCGSRLVSPRKRVPSRWRGQQVAEEKRGYFGSSRSGGGRWIQQALLQVLTAYFFLSTAF